MTGIKGESRRFHKGRPAASRAQSLGGPHRARRRGKGVGLRSPRAGGGSGAGAAARPPLGAGLGRGSPAGAARAPRRAVGAGRRLRMALTPRSQGRAAPRVSRPPAGCGAGAGAAQARPELGAETARGPPALSPRQPPAPPPPGKYAGTKEFTSGSCVRAEIYV